VEVVAADPHSSGRFLAGSPDALLSITEDGGDRWRPLRFPGEMTSALHAVYFDQARAGRIFAAVSPDSPGGNGLYRSDDLGASWTAVPAFGGKSVWSVAGAPSQPTILAAGTGDGVYLSRDSGDSWQRISPDGNPELSPVVSLAFDPRDPAILYAGTTHLPWKTSDSGTTWRSIHNGMLDDSDVFSIHVDPAAPASVLLSACSGIYRSANGGGKWIRMRGSADASYRTYAIVRDPADARRVFAGTSHGLLRSTDDGKTWTVVLAAAAKALAFDPADPARMLVATADRGLHRSADHGASFTPVDHGRVSRHYHSLIATGGRLYTSSYDRTAPLFASADGGESWRPTVVSARAPAPAPKAKARKRTRGRRAKAVPKPTPAAPQAGFLFTAAAPEQPELLYGATATGIRRSADGGKTWTPVRGPGSGGIIIALHVRRGLTPVAPALAPASVKKPAPKRLTKSRRRALRSRGKGRVAAVPAPAKAVAAGLEIWLATTTGFFRGSADGAAWRKIASVPFAGIRRIADSGGRVLVIGQGGAAWSLDEGASWTPLRAPAEGAEWNAIAAYESVLLAATSHGLFRSIDDGETWARVQSPVSSDSVSNAVFHRARPGVAFAAQYGAIFVSRDAGETWTRLDGDLASNSIHSLTLLPEHPGRVYALVAGRGIYFTDWETSQ
jgi:photosystem II stability/assembly factor-like uncharacterized protein